MKIYTKESLTVFLTIQKNDKAFASARNVTNKYMTCERLIKPAIKKSEIKEIILGGGQNLLSPERRFDAILFNSPGLFS